MTFNDNLSGEWVTNNDDNLNKLRFTLRGTAIDFSNWTIDGQQGFWMGLGFGNSNMNGTDMITCSIPFTNTDNDTFIC